VVAPVVATVAVAVTAVVTAQGEHRQFLVLR